MESDRLIQSQHVPLPWLTPPHLFLGLLVLCGLIMIISTCSMFSTSGPLPPPRDPPPLPQKSAVTSYRYKEGFYRSLVEEDAQRLKLNKPVLKEFRQSNPYFAEFTGNQTLKPGGKLETTHLRLQVIKQKIWVGEVGQGFRTSHLVLKITNKTDKHLAYYVVSRVKGRCDNKGIIPHNAIALHPHQEIKRTECLFNQASSLSIKKVEVMEVSLLGYHYISRLDPKRIQFSARTSEGHFIEKNGLPQCKMVPWQIIQLAFQRSEGQWKDVIDFYTRHNCDEYSFFRGYTWSRKPIERLPVKPPGADG